MPHGALASGEAVALDGSAIFSIVLSTEGWCLLLRHLKAEVSSSQFLVNPLTFNMEHDRGTHSIRHALTTPVQGTLLGWDSSDQCVTFPAPSPCSSGKE